jgi:cobyrinic acid a,c-diamide synthase
VSGGLIIAAPASGGGKTVVTMALLRHLRRRGVRAIGAKLGPDYIDPGFHTAAAGLPCRNLDPWAMRPTTLAAEIATLESAAEIVLCEGAMGLFDGTGTTGEEDSAADLAALTGWPVVLVVDARAQGASVAALVAGFARHCADVPIAGIILNRVGSARHDRLLRAALTRHVSEIAVLGSVARVDRLRLPERHLGLVQAAERHDLDGFLDDAATTIGDALDVEALLRLARPSRTRRCDASPPLPPLGTRIAVASDAAFAFAYPAVLEGWQHAGAALVLFSPLADEPPAVDADAVYLPGGYPELHAGRLAANARFLAGLRGIAERGALVFGECGGYMVLGDALTDCAGIGHAMAGLLPVETSFAAPRLHLGYRRLTLLEETPLGRAGARFRGHEFHYTTTVSEGAGRKLFRVSDAFGDALGLAGIARGRIVGSFMHLVDREEL